MVSNHSFLLTQFLSQSLPLSFYVSLSFSVSISLSFPITSLSFPSITMFYYFDFMLKYACQYFYTGVSISHICPLDWGVYDVSIMVCQVKTFILAKDHVCVRVLRKGPRSDFSGLNDLCKSENCFIFLPNLNGFAKKMMYAFRFPFLFV